MVRLGVVLDMLYENTIILFHPLFASDVLVETGESDLIQSDANHPLLLPDHPQLQ